MLGRAQSLAHPRAELDAPYFSGTGGALFWHLRNTLLIFGHTHMA